MKYIPHFLCVIGFLLAGGCAISRTVHVNQNAKIVIPRKQAKPVLDSQKTDKRLKPPEKDQPLQITSDRMAYQEEGKVTIFKGHVKVNQEKAWLFTPYLQVCSDKEVAFARNGIRLIDHERGVTVTARELDYKDDLSYAVIRDNVRLTTHDDEGVTLRIHSKKMEWKDRAETVVAQGDVVVHYKDTTATADVMTFNQPQRVIVLTQFSKGNGKKPLVKQKRNIITGETITLYIKERTYQIEGSAQAIILPESSQTKVMEKSP